MNPTRFFLYARKSTDDLSRQVRSIDDQLAELRELARREQLDVIEELVERQTAKKPGRPVFNRMLERIEAGEAHAILAWHPDRANARGQRKRTGSTPAQTHGKRTGSTPGKRTGSTPGQTHGVNS